jgi:hypothetical protein
VWGILENSGKGQKHHEVGNYLRQGTFLLVGAGLALAIDRYLLIPRLEGVLPEWLPLGVIEVALFPLVLLSLGAIVGPSKDISIPPRTLDSRGER